MASFADKRRDYHDAQETVKTANTAAARAELERARLALVQSPEAANARSHATKVRLSPW